MQQRGRLLDQALPLASRAVFLPNNRTPHCFQRFVGLPISAGVEALAGAGELGPARRRAEAAHRAARPAAAAAPRRTRLRAPWHALIVPTSTAAAAPLAPALATSASPAR